MHQEASENNDSDLGLFSYPSRALTVQPRREKTLHCQDCEEPEEIPPKTSVKNIANRKGKSASDMCKQCQSLGDMDPKCLGPTNKISDIINLGAKDQDHLHLQSKGPQCQDMRNKDQQLFCLGNKDLQCQCLLENDIKCQGLRKKDSKDKCVGNREQPNQMNKGSQYKNQRSKDLQKGPQCQDLSGNVQHCKKDWNLETIKYSDLLLNDKGPWDLWKDLDNEQDKGKDNESQNKLQEKNKGPENDISHSANDSQCQVKKGIQNSSLENQRLDSNVKALEETGHRVKDIAYKQFSKKREDKICHCQDTDCTCDKQQVLQKPFHIPTSCSLGSLYVHNNNDDSSCATVGMGCTQTGAIDKGGPKAYRATDIHNWQSGFTGCLDRVPKSSGGWAAGLSQQGSGEKEAGSYRPFSQSVQLPCTRNSQLQLRQDRNSSGSKCLRYLSHRYIPPLPKSHSFTATCKTTQEQPIDNVKLPNHTCVDDSSDDDETSTSLSFIRPIPARRPLCRTTSLYNTSSNMCTMPSQSYTYQTLSNLQDDRTPRRPRSFHEASRCSNLDYNTYGASSRPQSSQRRYPCASKSKSSPCKDNGKCSKIKEDEIGTSSTLAANAKGGIKYTTDKLRARTREDLNILLEHFYKQTQAVSEELVVLLQARHDLREQVDMRRIAIEQLLRIHTHDGDNPPSIHMGVLLPSPGSCSTQSSSSS